ncbi:MAG: hypothetical protein DDT36_01672 [Firmicutes bacterium]|nr:hypothetical protein [Bacillota bacterium]
MGMNFEVSVMMPFIALGWMAAVIFLVATVLAVHYYIAGKTVEYERAKRIAIILLVFVLGLILLTTLFLTMRPF